MYFNIGVALAMQEETEQAVAHYRKAIEIRPSYADAHSRLGGLLLADNVYGSDWAIDEIGNPTREAVDAFNRAVAAVTWFAIGAR